MSRHWYRKEREGKTDTRSNAATSKEQISLAGLQLLHFVFTALRLLSLDGICLDICPPAVRRPLRLLSLHAYEYFTS